MQGIKKISENIGHDGTHFFCLRCGKSGYDRMAQARGHLAMCQGTAIRKGVVFPDPNSTRSQAPFIHPRPVDQPVARQYNPVESALSGNSYHPSQPVEQQRLAPATGGYYDPRWEQRLAALENESHHMLLSRNQPGVFGNLLGQYRGLIIASVVVLLAVALMSRSQCASDDKKPMVGDVGKKALTKLVDKGITKGVDAFFKGIKL